MYISNNIYKNHSYCWNQSNNPILKHPHFTTLLIVTATDIYALQFYMAHQYLNKKHSKKLNYLFMKQLFLHLRKRQHITITSKLHTTVICNSFSKTLSEQEPSCHEYNRNMKTGQITLISIIQLLTIVKKTISYRNIYGQ